MGNLCASLLAESKSTKLIIFLNKIDSLIAELCLERAKKR